MLIVGLTGGIGAGKSAVAERFARLGVPIVDTDVIARVLTRPGGEAIEPIRAHFGEAVFDRKGGLDRAELRRIVFRAPEARTALEAILHPMIRRRAGCTLDTLSGPYALLVVPLLVETGAYRDLVQRILAVECPEALRIARVMARNGLDHDEVAAIVAAQASDAARAQAADDTIDNAGGLEKLDAAVAALHTRYQAMADAVPPAASRGK